MLTSSPQRSRSWSGRLAEPGGRGPYPPGRRRRRARPVAQLERELAVARRAVDTARAAAERDRDQDRLNKWIQTHAGGVTCVCGEPMRTPLDLGRRRLRHADGTGCPEGTYGEDAEPDVLRLARRFEAMWTEPAGDDVLDARALGQGAALRSAALGRPGGRRRASMPSTQAAAPRRCLARTARL